MSENIYSVCRLEPRSLRTDKMCICECVIGMNAVSNDDQKLGGYVDCVYRFPEDKMPMMDEFKEMLNDLVNQVAADEKFYEQLDNQIAAQRVAPQNINDFVPPEIVIDPSTEPTPIPDPVIPNPVVEPTTDEIVSEEGGE